MCLTAPCAKAQLINFKQCILCQKKKSNLSIYRSSGKIWNNIVSLAKQTERKTGYLRKSAKYLELSY